MTQATGGGGGPGPAARLHGCRRQRRPTRDAAHRWAGQLADEVQRPGHRRWPGSVAPAQPGEATPTARRRFSAPVAPRRPPQRPSGPAPLPGVGERRPAPREVGVVYPGDLRRRCCRRSRPRPRTPCRRTPARGGWRSSTVTKLRRNSPPVVTRAGVTAARPRAAVSTGRRWHRAGRRGAGAQGSDADDESRRLRRGDHVRGEPAGQRQASPTSDRRGQPTRTGRRPARSAAGRATGPARRGRGPAPRDGAVTHRHPGWPV